MKVILRLLLGCVVLICLLIAGVVLAVNLIDLNNYKDKIQDVAQKQTGRELQIDGDMALSYFPWVGMTLGQTELANAAGFGGLPFAKVASADIKVQLLPLLRKEVRVQSVKLNGLSLDLQRAADGSTNWDDLSANPDATSEPTADNNADAGPEPTQPAIETLIVRGLEIGDANIRWSDKQAGTDAVLSNFNFSSGVIELAKPFDFDTDFSLKSNKAGVSANVAANGNASLDLENQLYKIKGLTINTDAKGQPFPGGALGLALTSNITADLDKQTINLNGLNLKAMGIQLKGDVAISDLNETPLVVASVQSDAIDVQQLFRSLDIPAPQTADSTVLKNASFSLDLNASPLAADLQNLTFKLDDTTFKGEAKLPDLSAAMPPVRFQLALDAIDLDRYLPPTSTGATAGSAAEPEIASARHAASGDEPIALPRDLLQQLDVQGKFRADSVKVANLTTTNIVVPVNALRGLAQLEGVKASLYQGGITASTTVNVRSERPSYSFNSVLNGVLAEPLLQDLLQDKAPITGSADFTSNLSTSGNTVNQIKASLNGDFSADFKDGAVNGVNVGYQLRRAQAVLKGRSLPPESGVVKTDFSAMHIGATISNGVLQSNDLDVRSPGMRLNGDGSVDLVQEYVDYTLHTKVAATVEGQGGQELQNLQGLSLSIPVRGHFGELSSDFSGTMLAAIKEDFKNRAEEKARELAQKEADKLKAEAMAKANEAKAKARAALQAKEAEARAKLEAERARAEQRVQAELQEQRSRVNKQVDKLSDQLGGKAADKLKGLFK